MKSVDKLGRILARIDGMGYKAYREVKDSYDFGQFLLHVDHVQADPFAAPSKIRVRVPRAVAKFPGDLFANRMRKIALEDFLVRQVHRAIEIGLKNRRGTGKSGMILIDKGGQEVLERTACKVTSDWVEARMYVGLPAAGRKILGRQAQSILCKNLPGIVESGLLWRSLSEEETREFVDCVENQEYIRDRLKELDLLAFVADGAVLPRESGHSQKPLSPDKTVVFVSPDSLRVSIDLPNPVSWRSAPGKKITGMGIPSGVTLIVGGGYHGKSTLLQALERGVYPKIPGDGREYVVTSRDAVKIRAEDGRRIEQVDISPFISNLPRGLDTHGFCTDNASGSTSQAANIMEAMEMGAQALLLDEDTSATNFMVRDVRMQALVHKAFEPITPFIDRVREICQTFGVSTIMVMGGCGDYFDVADRVIMMREYLPRDVTTDARNVAETYGTKRRVEAFYCPLWRLNRIPVPSSFNPSRGRKHINIDAKTLDMILFGQNVIDLRCVEQLVDFSQTRAVGMAIHFAASRLMDGNNPLKEVLDEIDDYLDKNGLDHLDPFHHSDRHPGSFARPRKYEIAAAINRLRSVLMVPRS